MHEKHKRKTWLIWWTIAALAVVLGYPLSFGPIARYYRGSSSTCSFMIIREGSNHLSMGFFRSSNSKDQYISEAISFCYKPLFAAMQSHPQNQATKLYLTYLSWWGVHPFEIAH